MKKQAIIFISIFFCYVAGLGLPSNAQWDLSNGSATDAMKSGGTGDIGAAGALGSPHSNNGGMSINQTYNMGTNAMMPNQTPTQYNNYGSVKNYFGQNQNLAAQAAGQQLPATMTPTYGQQGLPLNIKGSFNGLPPTSLDSFVKNAGGHAFAIYGDEGTNQWPPINGFGRGNTINAGITRDRAKTITTGHGGDRLPTASGIGVEKAP